MDPHKREALRWVHRYAAGGAALAAIPIGVSHTASLAAIEASLMRVIGEVYGHPPTGGAIVAAASTFAVGGQALRQLALSASRYLPALGIPIRMAIAALAIEGLGRAIIAHHEDRAALVPAPSGAAT